MAVRSRPLTTYFHVSLSIQQRFRFKYGRIIWLKLTFTSRSLVKCAIGFTFQYNGVVTIVVGAGDPISADAVVCNLAANLKCTYSLLNDVGETLLQFTTG